MLRRCNNKHGNGRNELARFADTFLIFFKGNRNESVHLMSFSFFFLISSPSPSRRWFFVDWRTQVPFLLILFFSSPLQSFYLFIFFLLLLESGGFNWHGFSLALSIAPLRVGRVFISSNERAESDNDDGAASAASQFHRRTKEFQLALSREGREQRRVWKVGEERRVVK